MQKAILGIDLGGTKVMAAVFDGEGRVLGRDGRPTEAWRPSDEVFEIIAASAAAALSAAGLAAADLAALGIGSPGPLDPATGVILDAPNLGFKKYPLGGRLGERFGCPVLVENDVRAALYGEWRAGAARGASEALGVFIGTGVGGGLILNGRLYHGAGLNAGEVGHIIIKAGGPPCGCGNRGCLEALASRAAMSSSIREAVKQGRKTAVAEAARRSGHLSNETLREAYDAGDPLVRDVVKRAARYAGTGVGSLVNVLGPQVVVMGGGVVEAFGDEFVRRVEQTARRVAFRYVRGDWEMKRAALGDDAGVTGAALLAAERLNQRRAGEPA